MTKRKRKGAGWLFAVAVLIAILLTVAVPSVAHTEQSDTAYPATLHWMLSNTDEA